MRAPDEWGASGGGAPEIGALVAALDNSRATLAQVERWIDGGWPTTPEERRRLVAAAMLACHRAFEQNRYRSAARLAEILRKMHADNFDRERYAREQGLLRDPAGASEGEPGPVRTRRRIVIVVETGVAVTPASGR